MSELTVREMLVKQFTKLGREDVAAELEKITDLPQSDSVLDAAWEAFDRVACSLGDCIGRAFVWEATPQGHKYWWGIEEEYIDTEITE